MLEAINIKTIVTTVDQKIKSYLLYYTYTVYSFLCAIDKHTIFCYRYMAYISFAWR